jgi:gliding motility-associated-like protein
MKTIWLLIFLTFQNLDSNQIIIPAEFSPNGDNVEDSFIIKASNVTNFNCEIFNRWGELIYKWSNINSGWDGKNKRGKICSNGTYYYLLSCTDKTGNPISKKGFVRLIK